MACVLCNYCELFAIYLFVVSKNVIGLETSIFSNKPLGETANDVSIYKFNHTASFKISRKGWRQPKNKAMNIALPKRSISENQIIDGFQQTWHWIDRPYIFRIHIQRKDLFGNFDYNFVCSGIFLSRRWAMTVYSCLRPSDRRMSNEEDISFKIETSGGDYLYGFSMDNLHYYSPLILDEIFARIHRQNNMTLIEINSNNTWKVIMDALPENSFIRIPNDIEREMSFFDGKECHTLVWEENSTDILYETAAEIKGDMDTSKKTFTEKDAMSTHVGFYAFNQYTFYKFDITDTYLGHTFFGENEENTYKRIYIANKGRQGSPLVCPSGNSLVLVGLIEYIGPDYEEVTKSNSVFITVRRILTFMDWIKAKMEGKDFDVTAGPNCYGDEFSCKMGYCIRGDQVCDRIFDCVVKVNDEMDCAYYTSDHIAIWSVAVIFCILFGFGSGWLANNYRKQSKARPPPHFMTQAHHMAQDTAAANAPAKAMTSSEYIRSYLNPVGTQHDGESAV